MTQETTVVTTCDKCGDELGENSAYWCAYPKGYVPGMAVEGDWVSNVHLPDRLDICLECVDAVIGELIWKVAKQRKDKGEHR